MGKAADPLERGKKLFPKFAREAGKYPDGFHVLHPGASDKEIRLAEQKLKCSLPTPYKRFLQVWNGGILFGTGVMIYRIYKNAKTFDKLEFPVTDLVQGNQKRLPGIPKSYLQIASTGYGDPLLIDVGKTARGDVAVVQWSHEGGGKERTHKTLQAWLDWEMKIGKGTYDYDGNVK